MLRFDLPPGQGSTGAINTAQELLDLVHATGAAVRSVTCQVGNNL